MGKCALRSGRLLRRRQRGWESRPWHVRVSLPRPSRLWLAALRASGDPRPPKMSAIGSQPSPFGHLTRERPIGPIPRPPRTKPNFSEAEESSQGGPAGAAAWDSTGVPRNLPARATYGRFARACGSWGYGCRVDTWTCSEGAPLGSRRQGTLALPPAGSSCQGGRRPPERQGVEEEEGSSHPGLQVLAGVGQLCITSKAELHGVSSHLARRGYVVSTAAKERGPLVVTEEYNQCCFHLCGPARSCHLYLQDWEGRVALWFCRPFRMGLGCLCCCCRPMELRTFTSDNQLVGIVRQRCSIFSHHLEICNAHGSAVMKIRGSGAACRCSTKQEFQVLSSLGDVVAIIWKKWLGFREERNMDHDFFGVDMAAADLSNEERALLLAAAFLLNFMFFEVS
uniref:phospholipid scramblase 2-like n=1 Tax=Euleptes europaea TaxID=460621 RepID=UPI0025403718|nr:phospholipid scramblase 2-like [Euleptes europaea]